MNEVKHVFIEVKGLKLHVAEMGNESSSAVVFLHGFPEIAYSWRHQMMAVANSGYRALAPEYRGYGLSDSPPEPEKTTFADLFSDLLYLFDALSISKAVLIAKDFGVRIAYIFTHLHPDRVSGIVSLGVPFMPPSRRRINKYPNDGSYISRWQEPGRAEADFNRFNPTTVVRKIYILFSQDEVPTAIENQEILDLVDSSTPLPSWFSQVDLEAYGSLYEKSGFQTALQVPYRSLNEEFDISNMKIEAPALVITGGKDYSLKFPGVDEYIKRGRAKVYVPNYETKYIAEGSHFMQEQFPEQVNKLIIDFLKKYNHVY